MNERILNESELSELEDFLQDRHYTSPASPNIGVGEVIEETIEEEVVAVEELIIGEEPETINTAVSVDISDDAMGEIIEEMRSLLGDSIPMSESNNYTAIESVIENSTDSEGQDDSSDDEIYIEYADNDEEDYDIDDDYYERDDDFHDECEDCDEDEVEPEFIPENSPTILMKEHTSRFSGAIWYEAIQSKTVFLAGLGGIGSYVAFLLGRLSPRYIHLWDDDVVDTTNLSGQMFTSRDVGTLKTTAAGWAMAEYSNYRNVVTYSNRYTEASSYHSIMMCGFDNMDARKVYFENWMKGVNNAPSEFKERYLFIDGRLAAEEFQVFCLRGDDTHNIERYRNEFLFSSEEVEATICSYKQTTFMANMIGSVMVNLFVNHVANECDPIIPRDLPFITEYNAELMYFNTEH